MQYLSLYPLGMRDHHNQFCVKDLATLPTSAEGVVALPAVAVSGHRAAFTALQQGSAPLQLLVPERAGRLSFLQLIYNYNTFIYITLINVRERTLLENAE